MRAMVLSEVKKPLALMEIPIPQPTDYEVLIKISACGVCRTDLHVVDGELPSPNLPLIPGHQIVGRIVEKGAQVKSFKVGDRVGVPWLGGSCTHCSYCLSGHENLCDLAIYTGYQRQGGYAEYCVADFRFIFPIPAAFPDLEAAPLLCAGLIGYRALRMTEEAKKIGFFGFGGSAHLMIQVVKYRKGEVFAFTRPGDKKAQEFALSLGAKWAGASTEMPPEKLDAAIVFASVGELVPQALKSVRKGGIVVCAGIHMTDIPSFPYRILWEERVLRSVANLTRKDGEEFLQLAPKIPIHTHIKAYPLENANEALDDFRGGRLEGSAVLVIEESYG